MSRYEALEKEIKDREEELQSEWGKDHASAWEHLGDLHYEAGCCDDAPADADAKKRHYEEAIKAYTEAIKLIENVKASLPDAIKQNPDFCPDTASLYEKREKAYEAKGDFAKAMLDYKTADLDRFKTVNLTVAKQGHKIEQVSLLAIWGLIASVIGDVLGLESGIGLFGILAIVFGVAIGLAIELVHTCENKNRKPRQKGMAFLLVGGVGSWGKSRTLRALTGGNIHQSRIDITSKKDGKTYRFFIRRMSNTDDPEGYMKFIKKAVHQNIIITFSADEGHADAALQELSKNYNLRCFVLDHCFNNPQQTISTDGVNLLGKYAGAGIHHYTATGAGAADTVRAAKFRSYMEAETPF
ncbi:MAG: hypothetical protein MdMp014T_1838 [Treponematales bacterium]